MKFKILALLTLFVPIHAFGITVNRACYINSRGNVDSSSTTSTELGYISGVTSAVQTQLNAKESALTFSSPLDRTVNTISIPAASSGTNGYLTSANWSTFNAKESALTFSAPLTRTVNALACDVASGSQPGCLSAANWSTFNAKESALTFSAPLSRSTNTISLDGTANWLTTGKLTVGSGSDQVQLNAKAHSSQTVAIQEWQNSSGTALAKVTKDAYHLAPDGAAATPAYAFLNGTTSGMYLTAGLGSNKMLNFADDGTVYLQIDKATGATTPYIRASARILYEAGSAGAPSMSFYNAGTLGIYNSAVNELGFSSASTLRVSIGSFGARVDSGGLVVNTAGQGLKIKEGSNAKMGTCTLVGGTCTVSTTAALTTSRIFLTSQSDGGTPGFLRVTALTNATSFVVTSSNGADTSVVAWLIVDPA